MSQFPKELFYSKSHEWLRREDGDVVTIGITDHAQGQMGDLVFVDLPETNRQVQTGDDVAVVESVKTASDVYTPVSGEIMEINSALIHAPETVNKDPYGEGWIMKLRLSQPDELEQLLDAEDYQKTLE